MMICITKETGFRAIWMMRRNEKTGSSEPVGNCDQFSNPAVYTARSLTSRVHPSANRLTGLPETP